MLMALTLGTILPRVLDGAVMLVETIIRGKGESQNKKELGVSIAYTILEQLAKNNVLPAIPGKDELGGLVDGAVAIKNETGWKKAEAINGVILDGAQLAQFFFGAFQAGKESSGE